MKHKLILAVTALLLTIGLSSAAHASSFSYSLDDPIQTANPGDTVYFWANLAVHNQIDVPNSSFYINFDTYNVDSPLQLDDFDFFIDFSPFITSGDNQDNVLFYVTLPYDIATGTYFGSLSIYGGSDSSSTDFLGSDNFSITTVAAPSTVPEPASLLLLGTGLTGVFAAFKRKKFDQVV